ncbi:DUF3822 family protein [Larkinella soli]|uniref:DUF3822 family protein n=1 Tax=Larkinella soli TaxID=1770527 RepID=UPI001E2FBA85|nr:DUF3822 family protein [Larkinella soli]
MTPTIAIREDSFEASTASSAQHLCLEMGRDRFRFCVVDPSTRTCFWLEDYTFPSLLTENLLLPSLQSIYQDHPVLQNGFWKSVTVSVNSPAFTLVPSRLYRKEYASHYLQLMRGSALPSSEHALAFVHAREGFHSVFTIENALTDWLAATYPLQQIRLIHQSSALLQASAALDASLPEQQNLYLYFEEENVTIIYRRNRALRFCNRFAFKNTNDLVYYILYVIHELKTDPKQIQAVLLGEITPFAETYGALERFLPRMSFGATLPGLQLTPAFEDVPEHRYLSLMGNTIVE